MRPLRASLSTILFLFGFGSPASGELLIEAESFDRLGGWSLDTQFIEQMGSPYLLAHGLGRPVSDATTRVSISEAGAYRVFVRTFDWVARWKAPGQPGRFQVLVNGEALPKTLGAEGADWGWYEAGRVNLEAGEAELALRDLTGFDGRVDAIYLTTKDAAPPADKAILPVWRREMLGLPEKPEEKGPYDLVVIGGGYGGLGTALSAARQGLKVALLQNRPVLGGNGSSEIRVWSKGDFRLGKYPQVGTIVAEFADRANTSPGPASEFGDAHKERIVRAEPNIDLFLNTHAHRVEMDGPRIAAVLAFDTRSSARYRFTAPLFADCTGHGTIGARAGADFEVFEGTKMGASNQWRWEQADAPQPFPQTPWALKLTMKDFPYPHEGMGRWFWESGYHLDPIRDAEAIRDWNLRAVFGAFRAMKNGDGREKHGDARLTWVAHIAGNRESRRLMGDVVLTMKDMQQKRVYSDGCVPSTWGIDLHVPKKQYFGDYAHNPYIGTAVWRAHGDRVNGYLIPYRCFYSRNVPNLFMAGRNISVTHEALGSVRVMRTCGMMGEVVGKAAALCVIHDCSPRDVYQQHWSQLELLLRQQGQLRRDSISGDVSIRDDAPALPRPTIPYIDPATLPGIVVCDKQIKFTGRWAEGVEDKNYIGRHYYTAEPGGSATATFPFVVPDTGEYEVRLCYRPEYRRGKKVPALIRDARGEHRRTVDQSAEPPLENNLVSLGVFHFVAGQQAEVTLSAKTSDGRVFANALQVVPKAQDD